MEEYLRNKYMKKNIKKGKEKKKGNIKIYDCEEEEDINENDIYKHKKKKNMDQYDQIYYREEFDNYVESNEDVSDVPITITDTNTMNVIEISNKNKKKILDSLQSGCIIQTSYDKKKKKKKSKKRESDSDMSICRNKHNDKSDSDMSICRNKHNDKSDSDMSICRNKHNDKSDSDISICRNKHNDKNDSDMSICRNTKNNKNEKKNHSRSSSYTISNSRESNNSDVKLTHKPSNKHEFMLRKGKYNSDEEEDKKSSYSKDSESKKNQKTIYRDKSGKIISREKWIEEQKKEMKYKHGKYKDKRKKQEEEKKRKLEWDGGLVQKDIRQKNIEENEKLIKKKNIINYEFDSDYDIELKMKKRKDDPMNIYIEAKEENQENKKLTCRYQSPYNRFNIQAGYRWDGVIRGNGFEERRLEAQKMKEQENKLTYINNTADL
ncbi:pre-mRNA-splicing factor, putative [Plasmodium reichenowi]|uniref:Pre-mRNA-splicing factor, putative n=1 Tax=Plasmodium reichenowi TaxID=5854 RepID=A0A2P9DIT5_PLARE|nr:pre-mRNA-splicing factor, putative [Plasmodium reichenowi]